MIELPKEIRFTTAQENLRLVRRRFNVCRWMNDQPLAVAMQAKVWCHFYKKLNPTHQKSNVLEFPVS